MAYIDYVLFMVAGMQIFSGALKIHTSSYTAALHAIAEMASYGTVD